MPCFLFLKKKIILKKRIKADTEKLQEIKNQVIEKLKNRNSFYTIPTNDELVSLYVNTDEVVMPTYGGPTNFSIHESFFFKKPLFYTKNLLYDKEILKT